MTAYVVRRSRPSTVLQELDRLRAEAARKEKRAPKAVEPAAAPVARPRPAKKAAKRKGRKK